jgi:hypothetical protein
LTLSKLRSLKADMYEMAVVKVRPQQCEAARTRGTRVGQIAAAVAQCDLNDSTVAMAHLHFDRVVALEMVTKANRKTLAAACLILSFKFNAGLKPSMAKSIMQDLLKEIEDTWRVDREAIFQAEMAVYAALKFHLHVSLEDVTPYLHRLGAPGF